KKINFINFLIFCAVLIFIIFFLKTISHKNIAIEKFNDNITFENNIVYNHPATSAINLWANIFGITKISPPQRQNQDFDTAQKNQAQNNNLEDYTLVGTIISDGEYSSAVIIKKSENKYLTKKINDLLENFKIIEIARGKITLIDTKNKKKIIMQSERYEKINKSENTNTSTSTLYQNIDYQEKPLKKIGKKQTLYFTRDEINNYIYNELEKILTSANIVPHFENNAMIGVRINKLAPENVLARKFGLYVNDIITSINGRPIDTIEKGMKLWDNIKTENFLELEIIRDNRYFPLVINIK
ncbi:MAG TPA: hypothetical protein PLJ38_00460, partial [bacterium]|nr:hypothetical protein [bacterium]